MAGLFNPNLHPHGFHGFWAPTGGMGRQVASKLKQHGPAALRRVQDIGTTSNRIRARTGSGLAYQRGPAKSGMTPSKQPRSGGPALKPIPPHMKPSLIAPEGLQPGARVRVSLGYGAAARIHPGRVVTHHALQGIHHVTVQTAHGTKSLHLRADTRVKLHPSRTRSPYPRPAAYVDHQQIEQWWAGRTGGRRFSPLPRAPIRPGRGAIGKQPRAKVAKDAMTVTEDLGHDGQSPVTIMQGGSRLERCPICGYKLASDGHCPTHGNVLKAWGLDVRKDEVGGDAPPIPSTGEALGPTVQFPRGARRKRPPFNQPDMPVCPDCGGADGYHAPDCPRNVLNPGGSPQGLGA